MYCLYAIDNVHHGQKLYMQKNGFWTQHPAESALMRFATEDDAIDYAWSNKYRIYGAEYYAERIR